MRDIIEHAEAALNDLTEGYWAASYDGRVFGNHGIRICSATTTKYAEFIADARTLIPDLVSELKSARAEIDRLRHDNRMAT